MICWYKIMLIMVLKSECVVVLDLVNASRSRYLLAISHLIDVDF
jgi:hypothetical protein